MTTKALGADGEAAAAAFLITRGWEIVARNFRVREGEVDLIAHRSGVLAFVEVKTRRTRNFGMPSEAVTHRKQATIRTVARRWLAAGGRRAPILRFDVIEVTPFAGSMLVRHIEGAF